MVPGPSAPLVDATTMSHLSALLTQDQVVSPKAIDEAIQRQVISGGDFETNLLEVGAIGEDTLAAYSAALHGLRPVAREEVLAALPEAIARLPVMLALRYQVLPLRFNQGRIISAVSAPLAQSARAELEASVRAILELRCVTSARLAWGLSRFYGVPISPRLQRLIAKLDAAPPGPIPESIAIPLTRPRQGARTSTVGSAPSAAIAAFDLALAEDGESSPPSPDASVRTSIPEASPTPSRTNTAPLKRDPRPQPVPFNPTVTASQGPNREPILPSALRVSSPPEATPRAAPLTPPSTRPLPRDPRVSFTELPQTHSTAPAPPPPMTAPPPTALPTAKPPVSATKPAPAPAETKPAPAPTITAKPEHPLPPAPAIIEAPRVSIPMSPRTPSIMPAPVERVADSPLRSTTPAPVVTLSAGLFTLPPPPSAPAEQRPVAPVAPIAPSATTTAASASRGISLDVALQRLDATDDRDAVVEVMLDHAYERFAYVALLMVHGDHCAGVASRGDGVSGAALRELTITLQRPSILRLAHDSSAVEIASIEDGTSDAEVRARLQRREATEAVVVPLRIGSKVALLLWADNGAASSSALAVRQLDAFTQRCAEAFSRIIAARKRAQGRPSTPSPMIAPSRPPRPPQPDRNARLDALRKAVGPSGAPPSESIAPEEGRPSSVPLDPFARRSEVSLQADECDAMVSAALRAGVLTDAQLTTLVSYGERGVDAVFRHFPGPHSLKRTEAISKLPALDEAGILLRAAVALRHAALPRLLLALDGPDPDARYCALLCLGEVVHPSALPALMPKLTDGDYPTRMAAIEVMRAYRRFDEFEAVARSLRAALRDPKSPSERRRAAAHALGELRDERALEGLVAALADPDASLATAAHRALVVLARQDFGTAAGPWLEWWSRAAPRHRIEWLIDALIHSEPTIRHEASEELKRLTGQYFGYYFNLPRRERERAHQRYLEWWKTDGAQRFGASASASDAAG